MALEAVDTVAAKLAGVAGAAVSMHFMRGTWPERICMAFSGAMLSYFLSAYIAQRAGLPEGVTGFLLGLFGMAVVSRVWEWIQTTPVAELWQISLKFLRKKAGVK